MFCWQQILVKRHRKPKSPTKRQPRNPPRRRAFRRRLPLLADADDFYQQLAERICAGNLPEGIFASAATLRAYLIVTVRNIVKDAGKHLRRQRSDARLERSLDGESKEARELLSQLVTRDTVGGLKEMLEWLGCELAAEEYFIIILRWHGYTYAQIAAALDMHVCTVSRFIRAQRERRREWKE